MTDKIPGRQKTLTALANWIAATRQQVPQVDDAADTLLNQLAWYSHQANTLHELASRPRCLGLYGYCQAAKADLLSLLTGSESAQIAVAPGGRHLNYLAHINPSHAATRMAVRFAAQPDRPPGDWPLTLRLFSEAELVHIFMLHYQQLQQHQQLQRHQPLQKPPPTPAQPHSQQHQPQSGDFLQTTGFQQTHAVQQDRPDPQDQADQQNPYHQQHTSLPQTAQHLPAQPVTDSLLQQRIRQLQPLCQPQQQPAITAADIATLAACQARLTPQPLQPASWQQLITLLPQLNLKERAEIYALFWGEHPPLTRQWRQLAETLQTLGNVRQLAAPLNLIVDNFSLPVEGLLNGTTGNKHLLVCPLADNHCLPAVSVDAAALAFLTVELILPLAGTPLLPGTDLLDIPGVPQGNSLQHSKMAYLTDYYCLHQQPDILLICNAAEQIRNTSAIATRLLRWQQHTQPASPASAGNADNRTVAPSFQRGTDHKPISASKTTAPSHPGLIWVITPHDLRFSDGHTPDEHIQRLLGKPGKRWATLQALDSRNRQRMTEWLAGALSNAQRQQRLAALNNRLSNDLQHCFQPFTTPAKPADSLALAQQAIRELQQHAIHHGDLLQALLPDASLLQTLCQQIPQQTTCPEQLFQPDIDLFAEPLPTRDTVPEKHRCSAQHTSPDNTAFPVDYSPSGDLLPPDNGPFSVDNLRPAGNPFPADILPPADHPFPAGNLLPDNTPLSDATPLSNTLPPANGRRSSSHSYKTDHIAHRVYRYWINHVRQWTQQPQHASQLDLHPDSLRWLGDTLITTSYRLNLTAALQLASQPADQAGAQLQSVIGDFLCWLGYATLPPDQRPASRIRQGAPIFLQTAPQHPRLTRLPDHPAHAATHYVYDWLIALYSHAQQNSRYRHPLDLKPADRATLKKLLNAESSAIHLPLADNPLHNTALQNNAAEKHLQHRDIAASTASKNSVGKNSVSKNPLIKKRATKKPTADNADAAPHHHDTNGTTNTATSIKPAQRITADKPGATISKTTKKPTPAR